MLALSLWAVWSCGVGVRVWPCMCMCGLGTPRTCSLLSSPKGMCSRCRVQRHPTRVYVSTHDTHTPTATACDMCVNSCPAHVRARNACVELLGDIRNRPSAVIPREPRSEWSAMSACVCHAQQCACVRTSEAIRVTNLPGTGLPPSPPGRRCRPGTWRAAPRHTQPPASTPHHHTIGSLHRITQSHNQITQLGSLWTPLHHRTRSRLRGWVLHTRCEWHGFTYT